MIKTQNPKQSKFRYLNFNIVSNFDIRISNLHQRGVSLYMVFMVMTLLLGIGFGMSALLLNQLDTLKGIGYSVLAFYATDAGVEKAIYEDNKFCGSIQNTAQRLTCLQGKIAAIPANGLKLSNEATFSLLAEGGGQGGCPQGLSYCVKSAGMYKNSLRAVRVSRGQFVQGSISTGPHAQISDSGILGIAPVTFALMSASSFSEPQEGVKLSAENILGAPTDSGWVYIAKTSPDENGTTFFVAVIKILQDTALLYGITDITSSTYYSNLITGGTEQTSELANYMISYSKGGVTLFKAEQSGSLGMRFQLDVPWPSFGDPGRRYTKDQTFSLNTVIWESGDGVIPMTQNFLSWYLSFMFNNGLWMDVQKFNVQGGGGRFGDANHHWGSFVLTSASGGLPVGAQGVWWNILDAQGNRQPGGFTNIDVHSFGQITASDFELIPLETYATPHKTYLKKWRLRQSDLGVDLILETLLSNQEYTALPGRYFYEGAVRVLDPISGLQVGTGMLEQTHNEQ